MDFKPTVRIFCQLSEDYSLSIRNGKVVLALANPQDPFQHWIKEEVDGGGFTLFNKGTAQAMKRSPNISPVNKQVIEVLLISMPFGSDPDPDAVWIESNEGENTFTAVFSKHGDTQRFRLQPHSWLAYDGNTVLLTNQDIGPYQKWKFVPYNEDRVVCPKTIKIYCREKWDYNLTIRDDTVVFARCDRADPYQHWRKEYAYCQHLKDEQGFRAFAIVNVATGKAIQHGISQGFGYPVSLLPFNPMQLEESLLWTESDDQGSGFKKIKVRKNIGVGLDALFDRDWMQVGLQEGMRLGIWRDVAAKSHQWKMEEFF
ncbi:hypothetical protein FCM35_KLT17022 [Carex littledalei]|uniref:Uncharacterized protein n=1 Tax=Carex littledalei TaxID=544730 RepID=A0A833R4E7_9POAL|nr:hypothetical protein FCM35_KLT17022 [Carex littledalei]